MAEEEHVGIMAGTYIVMKNAWEEAEGENGVVMGKPGNIISDDGMPY